MAGNKNHLSIIIMKAKLILAVCIKKKQYKATCCLQNTHLKRQRYAWKWKKQGSRGSSSNVKVDFKSKLIKGDKEDFFKPARGKSSNKIYW